MRSSLSSLLVASLLGIGIGYYTFAQPLWEFAEQHRAQQQQRELQERPWLARRMQEEEQQHEQQQP